MCLKPQVVMRPDLVIVRICSEVARLEAAAARQSQEAAEKATERERQLHAARTAAAAAEQRAAIAQAAQQVGERFIDSSPALLCIEQQHAVLMHVRCMPRR